MDLVSCLSSTLWDLLQRTRLRPDAALELFDETLTPLFSASDDPRIVALRGAASIRFFAGSELSFRTVLQNGREARLSLDPWNVTLLPIRDNAHPVGLLAAVTHRESAAEWVGAGPGEAAARAWRDAIEGDLATARRLRAQEHRTNRFRALASFVADLQQFSEEGELLKALLQAIAVWHDVEPCAYSRDLAGNFTLQATLPGTDTSTFPASLEAGAMVGASAQRTGEWPILTQIAWHGRGTPLLVRVSSGSLEEWLIALTGPHEEDILQQLQPMLRGFAEGMERVREREARKLRQQLWDAMTAWRDATDLPRFGHELLSIICSAVDANQGLLTITGDADAVRAAGALVEGDEHPQTLVRDGYFTADVLSVRYPLTDSRIGSMELRRTDRGAFRPSAVTTVLAARPLVGAWLSGLRDAGEWHASFAVRDQPRVLRFTDSSSSAWT